MNYLLKNIEYRCYFSNLLTSYVNGECSCKNTIAGQMQCKLWHPKIQGCRNRGEGAIAFWEWLQHTTYVCSISIYTFMHSFFCLRLFAEMHQTSTMVRRPSLIIFYSSKIQNFLVLQQDFRYEKIHIKWQKQI